MSAKKSLAPVFGSLKMAHASYIKELRTEIFSRSPWRELVEVIAKEYDFVTDDCDLFFIDESHNIPGLLLVVRGIISASGQHYKDDFAGCLMQTWECLPKYLELFGKFHPDIANLKHPRVEFMDRIITGKIPHINFDQIEFSTTLKRDLVFSLDTRVVMKRDCLDDTDYSFAGLASSYKSKLKYSAVAIREIVWGDIDIEGIIKEITNSNGTRYYSISSDSFVNAPTVKKSANVNDKHRVVANKIDTALFNHIIAMLDNPGILTPITMKHVSAKKDIPRRISPPKITTRKRKSSSATEGSSLTDESIESSSGSSSDHFTRKLQNIPTTEPIKQALTKRKPIPAKVRQMTWRKYIGDTMDGKCWCCNDVISFEQWHVGHVIPVSKGGPDIVDNLRPLCQSCNLSMSNTPIPEFISTYNMKGKGSKEFFDDDIIGQINSLRV